MYRHLYYKLKYSAPVSTNLCKIHSDAFTHTSTTSTCTACLQFPICSFGLKKNISITEKMNCYRATVAAEHFSLFPSNKIATWPPICQGNMGYLGVLILTTVNKTKRTSVFIWYSATFPALSYQAGPRGSVLNAKQPGFAEKNTV